MFRRKKIVIPNMGSKFSIREIIHADLCDRKGWCRNLGVEYSLEEYLSSLEIVAKTLRKNGFKINAEPIEQLLDTYKRCSEELSIQIAEAESCFLELTRGDE